MKTYLYLLVFEDGKHFKIGISSKNFERVYSHNRVYKIDFNKSFIVTCPNHRIINCLEVELLAIYPQVKIKTFKNKDGYTEIRNIKYLDECIGIIDSKHKSLKINLRKFNFYSKQNIDKRRRRYNIEGNYFGLMEYMETKNNFHKMLSKIKANIKHIDIEEYNNKTKIYVKLCFYGTEEQFRKTCNNMQIRCTQKNNKSVRFVTNGALCYGFSEDIGHYINIDFTNYNDMLYEKFNEDVDKIINIFQQIKSKLQ